MSGELDYSNAPTHGYTVEGFVKMLNLRNPNTEDHDGAAYREFVHQVSLKVCELEGEYVKLFDKLLAKQEDIFEPTIKKNIGMNEITALCDLGASVSTIPKSLYDRLNLSPYIVI